MIEFSDPLFYLIKANEILEALAQQDNIHLKSDLVQRPSQEFQIESASLSRPRRSLTHSRCTDFEQIS